MIPGFSWPNVLTRLAGREDITEDLAHAAMTEIMEGRAEPEQIAAFIVSLRAKGESVDEMVGLVRAMYDAAVTVEVGVPTVDTAGTGGDRSGTFNISTTAAFVAAGAGAHLAKHGNRAASSSSGSADVLEALDIPIDLDAEDVVRMIEETRFGFFFAPKFHPAMRHAAPVRRSLGIPTVFNFLGPLANPARANAQAIGVSDPSMAERMIGVLQRLGRDNALVFYGADGLDELTTTGPSVAFHLRGGDVERLEIDPSELGIAQSAPGQLKGGDSQANAAITHAVLAGAPGAHRDIVILNAAAAILVAGLAETIAEGVEVAGQAIDDGSALQILDAAVALGRELAS
jgi:anthranilate phosphoribosyltransferase